MHRISGLTPEQERLYRHLLSIGRTTTPELVDEFGDQVFNDLHELTLRGLVLGDPPIPRRPSEALKGVLDARQAQLRAIEGYITDLDRLYDNAHHAPGGAAVQVLSSRTAVQRAYEEIHATAEEEVMQLITHPFLPLTVLSREMLDTPVPRQGRQVPLSVTLACVVCGRRASGGRDWPWWSCPLSSSGIGRCWPCWPVRR